MTKSTTQRRRRLSPQDREHEIIAAAIEFVSERGLSFSTRELASHCGISQSLLYRYFSSREELVEKIYENVYMGRWNPEWDDILVDRTRSVEQRLIHYLEDYARVVLKKDWVRIFLLSAFDDPVISQRYLQMLKRRIFEPLLDEILAENNGASLRDDAARAMALDLIWSFHSSFFYLGVRQWLYKAPLDVGLNELIATRVRAFLLGMQAFIEDAAA